MIDVVKVSLSLFIWIQLEKCYIVIRQVLCLCMKMFWLLICYDSVGIGSDFIGFFVDFDLYCVQVLQLLYILKIVCFILDLKYFLCYVYIGLKWFAWILSSILVCMDCSIIICVFLQIRLLLVVSLFLQVQYVYCGWGGCFLLLGQFWAIVVIKLERFLFFLVFFRRRDSLVFVRRGLCVLDFFVSLVLNILKFVILTCIGLGSVVFERVFIRQSEVFFLYLMVKQYFCSFVSIFCNQRQRFFVDGFKQLMVSVNFYV